MHAHTAVLKYNLLESLDLVVYEGTSVTISYISKLQMFSNFVNLHEKLHVAKF